MLRNEINAHQRWNGHGNPSQTPRSMRVDSQRLGAREDEWHHTATARTCSHANGRTGANEPAALPHGGLVFSRGITLLENVSRGPHGACVTPAAASWPRFYL